MQSTVIELKPDAVQRTLVLFKPDAVQRGLLGRLLTRFEDKGLKLVACKLLHMSNEMAAEHYDEHREKPFFNALVTFMTSAPIMALVFEGLSAVVVARNLIGKTCGIVASPGTIRGDFSQFMRFNLVHASDSIEATQREIALFFNASDVFSYTKLGDELMLFDTAN